MTKEINPDDIRIKSIDSKNGDITINMKQYSELWHYIGYLRGQIMFYERRKEE